MSQNTERRFLKLPETNQSMSIIIILHKRESCQASTSQRWAVWYNWLRNQGEVTEWFMVPLSKSGGQKCLVGSNPTLSVERCWSGLTGTPGERVSGFPRPWVRIPPSPPPTALNQKEDLQPDSFSFDVRIWVSSLYACGVTIPGLV